MTPWPYIDARYDRLEVALHDSHERDALELQLPGYLHAQRWFGGQSRAIQQAVLERWVELEKTGACICVVSVTDTNGVRTEHQLYLIAGPEEDGQRPVLDALTASEVRAELLALVLSGEGREGYRADLVCELVSSETEVCTGEGRLVGVEQSNSSIVYGNACILKVYRRLEHGENPDVELGTYLTREAGFSGVPSVLASARLESADGYSVVALMLQQYVPNQGDGWAWALENAGRAMSESGNGDELRQWLQGERRSLEGAAALGETTALLHTALAAATAEGLQPVPVSEDDLAAWQEELRQEASETYSTVKQVGLDEPELREVLQRIAEMEGTDGGSDVAGLKMRVHGDYHLGQVLRTENGFVVLDFEGEPARTLPERRALQHPLVDVAGMVRSWSYAAHTAGQRANNQELSEDWERPMRERFLGAYFQTAASANREFLPGEDDVRVHLLSLFELRKALYEIRYELNNRPEWVSIPAAAVVRLSRDLSI